MIYANYLLFGLTIYLIRKAMKPLNFKGLHNKIYFPMKHMNRDESIIKPGMGQESKFRSSY